MKLLLILGLLAALVFVVLNAGPGRKEERQGGAPATPPLGEEVPGLPSATPQARTHYRQAIDKAQEAASAVKARNAGGEF